MILYGCSSKAKDANSGAGKEEVEKTSEKEAVDIDRKIAMEERKYLVARRKLEAIRLIDFLFERVKAKKILVRIVQLTINVVNAALCGCEGNFSKGNVSKYVHTFNH